MRIARFAAGALCLGLGLAACSSGTPSPVTAPDDAAAPNVLVLGAASTRVLNDDLGALFPENLTFVNAGSSALVQQLRDGAPGDVLITADEKNMNDAVDAGVAENPQVVAANSMVLVVPQDNPAGIDNVADVQRGDVNLVLCDVQVPCGAVSQKLIDANNLRVTPVSLEHSVSDTLGKVVSGEADAGFVYRTDAAAAGDAVEVIDIPRAEEFPNSLVAAVVSESAHPELAAQLVALLGSAEMAPVWQQHGFTPAKTAAK